ncbi:hypothetical protein GGS21DRAFT_490770 [Xylaria nigripes]|nr:hypothetical protein GGS21DRAFT_490770 [Xylaria nigripes]
MIRLVICRALSADTPFRLIGSRLTTLVPVGLSKETAGNHDRSITTTPLLIKYEARPRGSHHKYPHNPDAPNQEVLFDSDEVEPEADEILTALKWSERRLEHAFVQSRLMRLWEEHEALQAQFKRAFAERKGIEAELASLCQIHGEEDIRAPEAILQSTNTNVSDPVPAVKEQAQHHRHEEPEQSEGKEAGCKNAPEVGIFCAQFLGMGLCSLIIYELLPHLSPYPPPSRLGPHHVCLTDGRLRRGDILVS